MALRISRYYNWFLRDITNKQERLTDGLNADGCLQRDGLQRTCQILSFCDKMMFFIGMRQRKEYIGLTLLCPFEDTSRKHMGGYLYFAVYNGCCLPPPAPATSHCPSEGCPSSPKSCSWSNITLKLGTREFILTGQKDKNYET